MSSLRSFSKLAERLAKGTFKNELHRGVVDAGRKTKTSVQRAVTKQMNLKAGNYNRYVVAGTRGIPRKAILAFDIFGVKGGTDIEEYRGLRSVRKGNRLNVGRSALERGTIRSGVWNHPRVFKRSFEADGNFYAMLPPSAVTSSRAPKALWTFGRKPNQPRGAGGKFASSGVQYGKIRRLFGPALMKEIPEDESLDTFLRIGPQQLELHVGKRIEKTDEVLMAAKKPATKKAATKKPASSTKSPAKVKPADMIVNQTEMAEVLGISTRRLRQLEKEEQVIVAEAMGRFHVGRVVQAYATFLREGAVKKSGNESMDRLRDEKALDIRLNRMRKDRELITLDEALSVSDELAGLFLSYLNGLPAEIRECRESGRG